jgi:hypothetical protein
MNKWDRIEKSRKKATYADIQWEYLKMTVWIVIGIVYLYFVFKT